MVQVASNKFITFLGNNWRYKRENDSIVARYPVLDPPDPSHPKKLEIKLVENETTLQVVYTSDLGYIEDLKYPTTDKDSIWYEIRQYIIDTQGFNKLAAFFMLCSDTYNRDLKRQENGQDEATEDMVRLTALKKHMVYLANRFLSNNICHEENNSLLVAPESEFNTIDVFFDLSDSGQLVIVGVGSNNLSKIRGRKTISSLHFPYVDIKLLKPENAISYTIPNFCRILNKKNRFSLDIKHCYRGQEYRGLREDLEGLGYDETTCTLLQCWLDLHTEEELEYYGLCVPKKIDDSILVVDKDRDIVKRIKRRGLECKIYCYSTDSKNELYYRYLFVEGIADRINDNCFIYGDSFKELAAWVYDKKKKDYKFVVCGCCNWYKCTKKIITTIDRHNHIKDLEKSIKERYEIVEKNLVLPVYSVLIEKRGFVAQPPVAYLRSKEDLTWREKDADLVVLVGAAINIGWNIAKIQSSKMQKSLMRQYEIEFGERARMRELIEKEDKEIEKKGKLE